MLTSIFWSLLSVFIVPDRISCEFFLLCKLVSHCWDVAMHRISIFHKLFWRTNILNNKWFSWNLHHCKYIKESGIFFNVCLGLHWHYAQVGSFISMSSYWNLSRWFSFPSPDDWNHNNNFGHLNIRMTVSLIKLFSDSLKRYLLNSSFVSILQQKGAYFHRER